MFKRLIKLLPLFLLLCMSATAKAQKPTLNISIVAYIEQKTVDYFGGTQAIQDSINKQLATVNALYNSQSGLNNTYNFNAISFKYFTDNANDDSTLAIFNRVPAEPNNAIRIVYNAFPQNSAHNYSVAFNMYLHGVIFCYNESVYGNGNLFERLMTTGLAHELGHSRGNADMYAGNLPANQNLVNSNLGWVDPLPSIMNSLFSTNTFDKYSLYLMNQTASLYGSTNYTDAQTNAIRIAAYPSTIRVNVLDATGAPASGAVAKFYAIPPYPSSSFTISAGSPTITQTTNSSGNIDFTGSSQNPFDISNGATANATLFTVVTYGGQTRYAWIPYYEASNAFIDGNSIYTKTISFSSTSNVPPFTIITPSGPLIMYDQQSTVFPVWAWDLDGSIASVKLYDSGTYVTDLTSVDPTNKGYWYWTPALSVGKHNYSAIVTDNSGASAVSAVMEVDVKPAHVVKAYVTSPANNATFTAPASITINGHAYEGGGSISKVEFYNGTTLLGTDTTVPYSFNWTGVTAGTYSITAKAYDSQSTPATATSAVTTIIVNTATLAPTVSITAPANNTVYNTLPASIAINATASETGGSISKVEFYNGATLLGTAINSPYSYTWTGVTAGTYSLTAKAYDAQSTPTTATSTAVSVYVNTPPTVSITAPASNSIYTAPATINITSTASDADGISKVEFYNGTTLIATVTASPYNYSWTSVAAGTYSITAKAYDTKGGITTSAAVSNIVVNSGSSCSAPQYVYGTTYSPGSLVKNAGNEYQCKPWPYSGWCNSAAVAYAPGTGTNWSDAWTLVGPCARLGASEESNNNNSTLVFPNPVKDQLTLQLGADVEGEISVTITTLSSETVLTQISTVEKGSNNSIVLSTEKLNSGIYILQAASNGALLHTSRVIVLK